MDQTTSLLIALAVTFCGFIPLLIALYKRRREQKLAATGIPAPGQVQEIYKRTGVKGNTYYYASIIFPLQNQRMHTVNYHFAPGRVQRLLTKHSTINIIYNPDKPNRFIIKEIPPSNSLIIITSIIAVAYVIIGFFLYDFMLHP